MVKKLVRHNILQHALTCFWTESETSDSYCKGVLVGVISGLVATGMTFEEALHCIAEYWPADTRPLTEANVPEPWRSILIRIMKVTPNESANQWGKFSKPKEGTANANS